MSTRLITETLELASQDSEGKESDDLFTLAYDMLYQRHPAFKELFVMDDDGSVRGSMLQTALEYILLYTDDDPTLPQQMRGACYNHQGYGVEVEHFAIFFTIIRDCIASTCGDKWQAPHTQAWDTMLTHFNTLVED